MNYSLLVAISIVMMLAGAGLVYVTLRGNTPFRPKDAFQWMAVCMSSILVVAAGFLLVLLVNYPASVTPVGPGMATVGIDEPAPNFDFRLVEDDAEMDLDAFKGKVVLLNFWATWCQPCLIEMPELNRLQDTYRDDGLIVLTISDEPRSELVAFREFLELKTVSGYIDGPYAVEQPFSQMVEVRPMTFIIDQEGIVRRSIIGAGTFEMFADAVAPYLQRTVAAR